MSYTERCTYTYTMSLLPTFENWQTTCFKMVGGASWSNGSKAGRYIHFVSIFFRAFLVWNSSLFYITTDYECYIQTFSCRSSEPSDFKYNCSSVGSTLAAATALACSPVCLPICPNAHAVAAYDDLKSFTAPFMNYLYQNVVLFFFRQSHS